MPATISLTLTLILLAPLLPATDAWTRYRGRDGSGVSGRTDLPVTWGPEQVAWKQALPGPGGSHPVIWQDRFYVTAYSGFDRAGREQKDTTDLRLHVCCLSLDDGSSIWQQTIDPESITIPSHFHGPSTPTPAVDAEGVVVSFGVEGLFAFDHDGRQQWHAPIGGEEHVWGSAASPVIWQDRVLLNTSIERSSVCGFDRSTGELHWEQAVPTRQYHQSWSTPIVVQTTSRPELIVNLANHLRAYDPGSGQELWNIDTDHGYATAPPILHDGIVYNISGEGHGRRCALAVRPGAVTEDQRIVWRIGGGKDGAYGVNCSAPVLTQGRLYWGSLAKVYSRLYGFYCVDPADGALIYKQEDYKELFASRRKEIYASAFATEDHIYYVDRSGGTIVVAADEHWRVVAQNTTGDEAKGIRWHCPPVPTPTGQLLLRSDWGVHCIGGG